MSHDKIKYDLYFKKKDKYLIKDLHTSEYQMHNLIKKRNAKMLKNLLMLFFIALVLFGVYYYAVLVGVNQV